MSEPTRISGAWYLIGLGLIISAISLGTVAFTSMRNGIDGMNRFDAPGRAKVTLPEGISTLYAEGVSRLSCTVEETAGRKVLVAPANGKVTYDSDGHVGKNAFDIDVVEPGDYVVVCESDQKISVAVGRGVGSAKAVVLVGLVPAGIGLLVIAFVFLRRWRHGK
jgi:hypothetical protein